MSEYIPKYPSKEGDDSNKTSSELLAETLKPIYVPQDLMLAWESHLASYSRDTNVLLDQVKDSELALNTQYQALLARVQKYEQMLQDITMDSNEFTMDTDEVNFTGWNILAQASYWDYLLRKEITKLSDQIKSTEYKGGLVTEVTDAVLGGLIANNTYISNVIGALSDTPLIRELDAALTSTVTSINDLQAESIRLAEKQAADAAAFADQQEEMLGQLVTAIEASKAEQLNRLAEEAAIRTQLLQELEAKTDAITADYNAVVDTLHTTVIQELTTMQDGISASVSELKTADEAIITSLDAYKVSNGQNIAALQNSVNVVTNTQESIATQVTGLIASFDQIDLGLSKAQADIITSNQARADGDAALSQQITTINTGLGDANSRIDTVNTAVSTLDTATATKFSELATTLAGVDDSIASVRQIADTAVSNDTAQATEINALKSRMTVTEGDVINKADASALSSLDTRVGNVEGQYTSQAADITQLSNSLDTTNVNVGTAQTAAQNAMNAAGAKGKVIFGNTAPAATDRLVQNLWIDTTGNANTPKRWNGSSWVVVTDKVATDALAAANAATTLANTKADSSALSALDSKVTTVDGKVSTNASNITTLQGKVTTVENGLATKAEGSALSALTTRVTNAEGVNTSQGSAITTLQNTVNHATTGLASKASSSAVTAVDNKVTAANGRIDTTNSNVATLTGRVSTVEGAVSTKAEASALTALTTRVSNAEGVNTSQGSAITTLENNVNHATTGLSTKASSAALTAVDNKVTAVDGRVTATNSAVTNLTGRVSTVEGGLTTKADVSAVNALTTRVGSVEGGLSTQASDITSLRSAIAGTAESITANGSQATVDTIGLPATNVLLSANTDSMTGSLVKLKGQVHAPVTNSKMLIDPTKLYKFRMRYRRTAGAANYLYIAVINYNATGDRTVTTSNGLNPVGTLINNAIYPINNELPALNLWREVKYYFKGKSAGASTGSGTLASPRTFPALATTVDIGILANNNKGSDLTQEYEIDYLIFEDATSEAANNVNAAAITSTNTEVSRINGVVSGHTTQLSNLTASIAGKADTSALNALTVRVEAEEGKSSSQATSITNLSSTLNVVSKEIISKEEVFDLTGLGSSTYYPLLFSLTGASMSRMRVSTVLVASVNGKPAWSTHPGGFTCMFDWESIGSGQGANAVTRTINVADYAFTSDYQTPAIGISQFTNSSNECIYLRGGAKYTVGYSDGASNVRLITASTTVTSQTVAPIAYRDDLKVTTSLNSKASASAVSTLDTKVVAIDGKVSTQASQILTLTSDNTANKNALQVQATVIDGVKANYMVKMGTNGVIGGFGLMQSTGVLGQVSTSFGVNADSFFIGAPVGGKKPFMVTTTNQVVDGITYPAGTWINSAIIANATIGSAHIKDAAITNAKIASLDASKITTGTLDANRIDANSISAEKLVIGDTTNLWVNPYFSQNGPKLENWAGRTQWIGGINELKSKMGVQLWGRDHIAPYSTRIPLKAGESFVIEYTAGLNGGPYHALGVGLWIYDVNDSDGSNSFQFGSGTLIADLGQGWARYRRIFQVWDNGSGMPAAFGCLYFQIEQGAYEANPAYWTVGDVTVRRQMGGELIVNGAITADKLKVGSLSAVSATIGVLRTSTEGARTEISDNLIEVFDSSGKTRIKIGVWE